jgi:NADH-quinone oxidoreductase subunit F
MDPIKVLTANIEKPNSTSIDVYIDGGGYKAIETALKMKPEEVTQLVKDSEMRGRGGAGFPTGMKWGFVPKNAPSRPGCSAMPTNRSPARSKTA